jgi:pimeloyl-ACP methyl ester carboxylesterase
MLTTRPVEMRRITRDGVTLEAAVAGSGPLVVLVHGFPEAWISWRHQVGPLADAGYQVCALSVRGYDGSDAPGQVADYDMEQMIGDVAASIEALGGGERAVIVGHDWGAAIVWATALVRPDRVRAVAGLSVPYFGQPDRPAIETWRERFTAKGHFFYQERFQEVGPAEAEFERDVRAGLRKFYYALAGEAPDGTWPLDKPHGADVLDRLPDPDPFPAWLEPQAEDAFVRAFERSGFFGPISRYRNAERDFAYLRPWKDKPIEQPALFLAGDRDLVVKWVPGDIGEMMRPHVPNLEALPLLAGCGHWTQQERPRETNEALLGWLARL